MKYQSKQKQSGIALITAILIIALAVTASVSIASNYQLNFHRTENAFNSGQAWAYAKGAEEWAYAILARDQKDNQANYDGYDEAWWNENEPLVFPLPNGYIEGKLEDAQGKLNINQLKQGSETNTILKARFERLFTLLDISPGLVCAIIDWIDADSPNPECPEGAESDIYIGLETPYLPADAPMRDITELRLVYGITDEIYEKLLPHITALADINSVLNINTATAEVLESLGTNMPPGVGEELASEASEKGFKQVVQLQNHSLLNGTGAGIDATGLGVGTNHFILNTSCVIGKSRVRMQSTIYRGGGNNLQAIKRSQNI